ncbi:hypothetical protein EB796_021333 [Bugula neritina]|uniref:Uncharacterized protein n=1 Tax=Bugula neritina TaxID=10212 RepID=A0A7J7J3W8_BUGNE|nr:hypothetical protein EB796_021333 [Bugula neritina]
MKSAGVFWLLANAELYDSHQPCQPIVNKQAFLPCSYSSMHAVLICIFMGQNCLLTFSPCLNQKHWQRIRYSTHMSNNFTIRFVML